MGDNEIEINNLILAIFKVYFKITMSYILNFVA